jgi:hypothetical protein
LAPHVVYLSTWQLQCQRGERKPERAQGCAAGNMNTVRGHLRQKVLHATKKCRYQLLYRVSSLGKLASEACLRGTCPAHQRAGCPPPSGHVAGRGQGHGVLRAACHPTGSAAVRACKPRDQRVDSQKRGAPRPALVSATQQEMGVKKLPILDSKSALEHRAQGSGTQGSIASPATRYLLVAPSHFSPANVRHLVDESNVRPTQLVSALHCAGRVDIRETVNIISGERHR